MSGSAGAPLPPGVRLLHIGPPKTGTTTLQAAFHQNREELARQGVLYAGRTVHAMAAAMAASRGSRLPTHAGSGLGQWHEILDEIGAAGDARVVVSSEAFSEADDEHIARILDELGRERTHVVVTLRPLVRILASQWQQFVQNCFPVGYEDWLDQMLRHSETTSMTPAFWRRHRYDVLVSRWAKLAGPGNVTVVAIDEHDRGMLTHSFEQLLALAPGTLTPHEETANRSLTLAEVELLRAFNQRFRAAGRSMADYTTYVRFGAARHLQQRPPAAEEPRILTPAWAVERAGALGAQMARGILGSGAHVVGDLAVLAAPLPTALVGENPPVVELPAEVAGRFVAGLVRGVLTTAGKPVPKTRTAGDIERAVRRRHRDRSALGAARLAAQSTALRDTLDRPWRVSQMSRAQLLGVAVRRLLRRRPA